MTRGRISAAFVAFVVVAWSLAAPRNLRAQAESEAPVQSESVRAIGANLGDMGFQALPIEPSSQIGSSDLEDAAAISNLPQAPAVRAGAQAALPEQAQVRASEAVFAPQAVPALPRSAVLQAASAEAPSAQAAPISAQAHAALPRFLGKNSRSRALSAEAALEGMANPDADAQSDGSLRSAMAAGDKFDGSDYKSGKNMIVQAGAQEDESKAVAHEIDELKAKLYYHLRALENASITGDPATRGMMKKMAQDLSQVLGKIETAGMPEEVQLVTLRETANLMEMNPRDSEAQKIKTYLTWLTAVPWGQHTTDRYDLAQAKTILDRDHSGLEGVKRRVLEFLAVRKRTHANGGGIILFIGPPGVGKTSIAQGIAEAMGRKFERFSLGGVADETDIRGHNRTYLGSQPGSIIQLMKRAGVNNPVILLDEIDKMPQQSGRGSAQPAFLEILDPEQNSTFRDHYLEVPYNLSNVLFIVTANDMSGIPPALRDRMEIIEFSGYTTEAKAAIIKNQVLPQTAKSLGLDPGAISISRDAMDYIIESYTAEPGVRDLKRQVGALLRGLLVDEENSGQPMPSEITKDMVRRYLGRERYSRRAANVDNGVGYASGLAVNGLGGSVLGIEVLKTPGDGALHLRKQMKDQFDDSAHNAYVYIKSQAAKLGIPAEDFKTSDLDIAVSPATLIDGPSAGITMVTAMVSEMTGRAVKPGIAMTGEFTVHGMVKPIGGLKDKVMAAYRLGYNTVIFPAENERDIELLPQDARQNMNLIPVSRIDQVLDLALEAPAPAKAETRESAPRRSWWRSVLDFLKPNRYANPGVPR